MQLEQLFTLYFPLSAFNFTNPQVFQVLTNHLQSSCGTSLQTKVTFVKCYGLAQKRNHAKSNVLTGCMIVVSLPSAVFI